MRLLHEQIREIERERLRPASTVPAAEQGAHAMVRLLARVIGIGVETTDMLVHEILSRDLRDRRAIARDAGLIGRGKRRREKGLARAGKARVRHGMVLLGWRFLQYQKDSALAQWFTARTADGRGGTRKTMIVALGRKLLIALWRLVTTGEIPTGVVLALHDARGGRQPIRRTGRGLLARIFRGGGAIAGSRELVVSVIFFEARVY
ncbi:MULTISPECIES: hypothetical protein [unclassified Mesorhizobium]|uniref:hypothetical protein n=1 Tax=unclassified Mesorhizobium TaxID=325217 RepID=UPI0033383D50